MPWDVENYYIVDDRVLRVEITIPLIEFLYTNIDDVKEAWLEMLDQFVSQQPGIEMSWEMQPRDEDAIVTVQIAKAGELGAFTDKEARGALDAVDALFDADRSKKKKSKKKSK
ncbi:MAG: hypothetical protein ACP6KW_09895 [Candidatus Thorarchaeota archaeon]